MFGMDIPTRILAGCTAIPALIAVRMQWRDHDRGTGGATMGVMMVVGHLWLLSSLFAGIALGVGMVQASAINRWLFGILAVVGGYFLSLILRSLVASMAERFKQTAPQPHVNAPIRRAKLVGDIPDPTPAEQETNHRPRPGALHFRPARNFVRSELVLLSFAYALMPFILGAYAVTLAFPAMNPRFDVGALVAAFYLLWHFRVEYPRQLERELARDYIVEPEGVHITRGGALVFLPWLAMVGDKAKVTLTEEYFRQLGSARLATRGSYRARYSIIPKPQELEDTQGYIDAIRRHAPENNPLRLYVEDWVARGGRASSEREQTMAIVVAVLLAAAYAYAYWSKLK